MARINPPALGPWRLERFNESPFPMGGVYPSLNPSPGNPIARLDCFRSFSIVFDRFRSFPISPPRPLDHPKTLPRSPKNSSKIQDDPRWPRQCPKMAGRWLQGLKNAPARASKTVLSLRRRANFVEFACPFPSCVSRAVKVVQDGPKMAPRWPQERPRWPQEGPR